MDESLRKILWFICLVGLYAVWVIFEQRHLQEPLYELSRKHIIFFRTEYGQNKLLQKFFSLVSFAGDKGGLAGCCGIGLLFLDSVHGFMLN